MLQRRLGTAKQRNNFLRRHTAGKEDRWEVEGGTGCCSTGWSWKFSERVIFE